MALTVAAAIHARQSVRAFLDRPVDRSVVEQLIDLARFAPSGGDLQPWRVDVLSGSALVALKAAVREAIIVGHLPEPTEYPVYPPGLDEPWRSRRRLVGEQLYNSIGIGRDDRAGRMRQFARNFELFGAPVGLFFSIPRHFGSAQWAHLGMLLQNIMLLAVDRGLGTCAQESWAAAHSLLRRQIGLPDGWIVQCGMALGYPDGAHPINRWRSEREPTGGFAPFQGFGSR